MIEEVWSWLQKNVNSLQSIAAIAIIIGGIVPAILYFDPRGDSEPPQRLVFQQASLFTNKDQTGFSLDLRVHNPSDKIIDINEFTLRFNGDSPSGGLFSVRKVSAVYIIDSKKIDNGTLSGPTVRRDDDDKEYKADAWYPSISSDSFVMRGNLGQTLKAGDSDRFNIVSKVDRIPLPSHNTILVELQYNIGTKSKKVESSVKVNRQ